MLLLREELGKVLRDIRLSKGKTLRQVSIEASVALGYLSEIERGHKEVSSEIFLAICDSLGVGISKILKEVSDRIAVKEALNYVEAAEIITNYPRNDRMIRKNYLSSSAKF